MDNELKPVEDLITSGLGRRFTQVFGFPVLFTNAPDRRALYAEKLRQNPNLKLPFAFASFSSQAVSDTRYSPPTLLRRGVYGSASDDMVQTYRLRILPVTTTYQVTVLVDSLDSAQAIVKRWLIACVKGTLKFNCTFGIVDLTVNVDMDREMQVPPSTTGVDEQKEYELTANIRVEGYVSESLEKAQAAVETEVEGRVGSSEDVKFDLGPGRVSGMRTTQVFKFNRPWPNT